MVLAPNFPGAQHPFSFRSATQVTKLDAPGRQLRDPVCAQPMPFRQLIEQGFSSAQQHRMNDQLDLIQQAGFQQIRNQRRTAHRVDGLSGRLLQCTHLVEVFQGW